MRDSVQEATIVAAVIVAFAGCATGPQPAPSGGVPAVGESERAVALGFLLDTGAPPATIARSALVAERLRRHYGIDTGNVWADREAAARRALDAVAAREFTEEQIAAKAAALGYSLDPAVCTNTCANVRRLAEIELQRDALADLAGP
jgi:hypothetical protein